MQEGMSGAMGGGFGIGAGLGQMLAGMFGGDPAAAANKYYNQIPGMISGYYNPYIQAGNAALPQLQSQYGQLMNNPGAMINKFGTSFHQSPGFNFQVNQALGAANRAAAAGGMAGSPMEQQNLAGTVNGLANQDYYNYLNHVMNAYGMGLQGEGDLAHMGFNASSGLAQNIADAMMNQGNMAYSNQVNRNQSLGSGLGSILGGAGMLAGAAFL
jgi:hypothetical protein